MAYDVPVRVKGIEVVAKDIETGKMEEFTLPIRKKLMDVRATYDGKKEVFSVRPIQIDYIIDYDLLTKIGEFKEIIYNKTERVIV